MLNSEQTVQVCDATMLNGSTTARPIIKKQKNAGCSINNHHTQPGIFKFISTFFTFTHFHIKKNVSNFHFPPPFLPQKSANYSFFSILSRLARYSLNKSRTKTEITPFKIVTK